MPINDPALILKQAHSSILSDRRGCLSPYWKVRLWELLGPRLIDDRECAINSEGLYRRVGLANQAVTHVMNLWDSALPADRIPHQLLSMADSVLHNQLSRSEARSIYSESWLHVDNVAAELFDEDSDKTWIPLVGYAACRTLAVAIYDETFSPSETGNESHWTDPYSLDPAEYASAAYAGGHPNDPSSDHEKRRDYWSWYCLVAIPTVLAR